MPVADQLFRAGIVWLAYLGIEPWIRRHWPTSLISWTRLLVAGRSAIRWSGATC